MTTSIFIKTWRNDIEWLKYCLRSIQRFGSEIDEVIVVADESCRDLMAWIPSIVSQLIYVPDWPDGRIQQQAYKLLADTFCKSEFVLFTDSDCLFTTYFSPRDFFKDDKPVIPKTKYELVGPAQCWKTPTESFLGFDVEWEYMRRLPMLFRRDTLNAIREMHPGWHERLKTVHDSLFSEFNVIGAFAEKYESEKYFFTDTEVWNPPVVARQFWSWGGFTPEVMAEIKSILHEKW